MGEITSISGVPTLMVQDEKDLKDYDLLIDVRRPDEYTGELGHIKGAKLVTLGEELTNFLNSTPKDKKILFICRSGMRSSTATREALEKGFSHPVNMAGGMIEWREKKLKTEI